MFINFDDYVDFLCEHKISANQLLFCYLLHSDDIAKSEDVSKYKKRGNLYKYYSIIGPPLQAPEIDDLLNIGFVRDLAPEKGVSSHNVDEYEVTSKFRNNVSKYDLKTEYQLWFQEFWEEYPYYSTFSSGVKAALKNFSPDDIIELYLKAIKYDEKYHRQIVNAVKWGNSNNYISQNIKNFINSKSWIGLMNEMKKEGSFSTDV